ncbi:hypothetical protein OLMES_0073 [Oleiphilus messinensis]|uniref:Uncharacterized protein n=1 Tax=Oleiphilus messinensis TaxID=141451 RepID=A0A1Y0I165_9GAMM|nr:hypothetical protein [Oleiphilus messinensis]ARU54182.1 hypothetical protein OLMES_0073 [Oleiphilus messinensis]
MKNVFVVTISLLWVAPNLALANGSPWLPAPDSVSIALETVYQSGDEFYLGANKIELGGDLDQITYWLKLGYGLSENLALDARIGYSETDFEGSPTEESDIADSNIGVTWRFVDEFVASTPAPSLAFRIGATIAGDYDTGAIDSLGDGASGVEASFLAGRILNDYLAISTELGYRIRESDVPDEFFYGLNTYFIITPQWNFSLGYQAIEADGDLDIGTPEFTAEKFNQVDEDTATVTLGISFNPTQQLNLNTTFSQIVDGRNTLESKVASLSVGYSF